MKSYLVLLGLIGMLTLSGCCEKDADCAPGEVCKEGMCTANIQQQRQAAQNGVAPVGPLTISFDRELTTCEFQNQYGICHLAIRQGGQGEFLQKYIYGPFNRQLGDADCAVVGNDRRHPLILADRRRVVPNDANARLQYSAQTLDHIERCNAGGDNCYNFAAYQPRQDNLPICRIPIADGELYTRIHQQNARFILVAQKEDGSWIQDTFEFQAEDPVIQNVIFRASERDPRMIISYDYQRASIVEMMGCEAIGAAYPPMHEDGYLVNSSGHFEVQCPIEVSHTYMATAVGLDPNYWKQKRFVLQLDPPSGRRTRWERRQHGAQGCADGDEACYAWAVNLDTRPSENPIDNVRCDSGSTPHCAGRVDLFWSVLRDGRVEEQQLVNNQYQMVHFQEIFGIPWSRSVHLFLRDNLAPYNPQGVWMEQANAEPPPYVDIQADGTRVERRIFSNFVRNHQYSDYKIKVVDFNGAQYWSNEFHLGYPSEFSSSLVRNCAPDAGGHPATTILFQWRGRHVKEIQTLNCGNNVIFYGRPSVNSYLAQAGTIRFSFGSGDTCLRQQNSPNRCIVNVYDFDLPHIRDINGQRVAGPEWQILPLQWQCCP